MKVLLGMLARETGEPYVDRILEIVAPSFDGVEVLRDPTGRVTDFAAQRNRLVELGEREGYDWMFMLDADECMFPADLAKVRKLMERPRTRLIVMPRIEMVQDFDHWDPTLYPDYQRRVFKLGVGYRFRRPIHEGLYRPLSPLSETRLRRGLVSEDTPIYHYSRTKPRAELLLRFINYDRVQRGQTRLESLPEGEDPAGAHLWNETDVFVGENPLRDL